MNSENDHAVGSAPEAYHSGSRVLILLVGIAVAMILIGLWVTLSQTTPGVSIRFRIDDPVEQAAMVKALQRRAAGTPGARVHVRAIDGEALEVSVGSRDPATIQFVRKLIVASGVMRFRIIANSVDHGELIDLAKQQAVSNPLAARDVLDDWGDVVGRWAEVGRVDTSASNLRPLRVNVSDLTVRRSDTGSILDLPAELRGPEATETIAAWMDANSIPAIDVLTVVDEYLDVGGADLVFAATTFDQLGNPAIAFSLSDAGSGRFFALTTNNSPTGSFQRQLGIILDDNLLSAPNILQPIRKEGRITGQFTREEVMLMVELLQAGSLPSTLSEVPGSEAEIEMKSPVAALLE